MASACLQFISELRILSSRQKKTFNDNGESSGCSARSCSAGLPNLVKYLLKGYPMKVKELITQLQNLDPEAIVLVAGFETQSTGRVAEADIIKECLTVSTSEDPMQGNRKLSREGEASVWLGWRKDYRTEYCLRAIDDPDELA